MSPSYLRRVDTVGWESIEPVLEEFERAWRAGPSPAVEAFARRPCAAPDVLLIELVQLDLEYRLRAGETSRVEDYLLRFPRLHAPAFLRPLLSWEYASRARRGQPPDLGELNGRFPHFTFLCLSGADGARLEVRLRGEDTIDGVTTTPPDSEGELAAPASPPAPAAIRYQPLRFHAQGGLGEVLVAHDTELGREVALKRLRASHALQAESRRRFLREAALTARLEHPGVVPVHGLVLGADGLPCYAMRFIEGQTLQDALSRFHAGTGPGGYQSLVFRQLLTRFVGVCHTLAYAHSRGVIHRDLKPQNIMLGEYGETLVVDWGLSKEFSRPSGSQFASSLGSTMLPPDVVESAAPEANSELTAAGQALGTVAYMSPEQAQGDWEHVGPTSDIFSLGSTLYALLTGRGPYQLPDRDLAWQRARQASFEAPSRLQPNVPRALEAICLKALALLPARRYVTAGELAADVERWLADERVTAWQEPRRVRLGRWARRHRTLVTSGAVAALLVAASAVAGVYLRQTAEQERQAEAASRITSLRSTAEANEDAALTELRRSQFTSAESLLRNTVDRLRVEPELHELADRLNARREQVHRLVEFYRLEDRMQNLAMNMWDDDAMQAGVASLRQLGVYEHEKWWEHLPAAGLTAEQHERLRVDAHRQLLLLACFQAKAGLMHYGTPAAAPAARAALETLRLAQRYRVAHSGRILEVICLLASGQIQDLKPISRMEPTSATDYYLCGLVHYWMAAIGEDPIGQLILGPVKQLAALDYDQPMSVAEGYLRTAVNIDPLHPWTHWWLAALLSQQRRHAESELALDAFLSLRPQNGFGYEVRAATLLFQFQATTDPAEKARCLWRLLPDLDRAQRCGFDLSSDMGMLASDALGRRGETLAFAQMFAADVAPCRHFTGWNGRLYRRQVTRFLEYLRWPRVDAELADTWAIRGQLYVYLDNPAEASRAATEALRRDPQHPLGLGVRGAAALVRKEWSRAEADLKQSLLLSDRSVPVQLWLAESLEGQKKALEALAAYDRVIEIARIEWQVRVAHRGRARALEALDRQAEAQVVLAMAFDPPPIAVPPAPSPVSPERPEALHTSGLPLRPVYAAVFLYRGMAAHARGAREQAEAEWQQALTLDPAYAHGYLLRGDFFLGRREWEAALRDFDTAVRLDPRRGAYVVQRARVLLAQDKEPAALEACAESLRVEPQSAPLFDFRAGLHACSGRWPEAVTDAQAALQLETGQAFRWHRLALIHLAAGDQVRYREVCGQMHRRFKSASDTDDIEFLVWTLALGDAQPMVEMADKFLSKQPRDRSHLQTSALAYHRAGRQQDALQRLRSVLQQWPAENLTFEYLLLAQVYQKLGQKDEGLMWLARAREKMAGHRLPEDWPKLLNDWPNVVLYRLLLREAETAAAAGQE